MAKIYLYDVQTELDKVTFQNLLAPHEALTYPNPISLDTVHEDAEVVSFFVTSTLTREMMEKMPKLRLIACRSTGYNNVDLLTAKERGITIVTVPSYGENTVAEYTFALLLALTRRVSESTRLTKENAYVNPHDYMGIDLVGKTLGVLGTGKIGRKVIGIAKGFEMSVIAYDPHEDAEYAKSTGFTYAPIEEVLKQADILTLHMPLLDSTYHLIDEESFHLMKDGVLFVNTARGELVNTKALIAGLESKKVSGAALDVVEGEDMLRNIIHSERGISFPLLEESLELSILKSLPHVILSPHLAYNTKEAVGRINQTACNNIVHFLKGETENAVSLEKVPYGKLILVRHTESEWNKAGKWTGTRDVDLSMKGFQDARLLGEAISDIMVDKAYASMQIRTMETLTSLLGSMRQPVVPIEKSPALNERDYGDYTGKNKEDMHALLGDEMFEKVRRGFDIPVPHGETLKDVYARIVPFYEEHILKDLKSGKNVLVVSHGNALRALIKFLESVPDDGIEHVEMMFGGALVYQVSDEGKMLHKDVRKTPSYGLDSHV